MANNRNVYQQLLTVSIPKKELQNRVIENLDLSKKDLRVFLLLLLELDGYSESQKKSQPDPLNFKKINIEQISEVLEIKEKDVKESIKNLCNNSIIEEGSSRVCKKGYRFTF